MKIVFIHGINQQDKDPVDLKKSWIEHLELGMGLKGGLDPDKITMPFYGNKLRDLTKGLEKPMVVEQGDGAVSKSEAEFLAAGLNEMANAFEISDQEISQAQRELATEMGAVQQGFPMHRKINAIARAIEKYSPFKGSIALRALSQAHSYLKEPGVDMEIDAIVRPSISDEPTIVIAHSLGTVVAFKLLREMGTNGSPANVPLFITLGSPLALSTVQASLGPRFLKPQGVAKWVNALDPDDFVTLGKPLNEVYFSDDIDNYDDIDNIPDDDHAIDGYLQDKRVAGAVSKLLYK